MNDMCITNHNKYGIVVSSRDIAKKFDLNHDSLISDLEEILESSDVDKLIIYNEYLDGNDNRIQEYLLTKKGFILYLLNNDLHAVIQMNAIDNFEEIEEQLKAPQTYGQVLMEAAKAVLALEDMQKELDYIIKK